MKKLAPDVLCMVEALAEGMAVLQVDAILSAASGDVSAASGDVGAYERKLAIARATEAKK